MTQLRPPALAEIRHPRLIVRMAYAAKLEGNTVRIVNTANGATVRSIGGPFKAVVIQGEEVHLTLPNGRVRVVNIRTGATIRTI